MRILGLSAFHRDSAAALLVDGVPVAAEKEERFTRRALESGFPSRAARACLTLGGVRARELDAVVFYEKPLRKFERLLATQLRAFPRSAGTFARTMFVWLGDRLWLKTRIADELEVEPDKVLFCEHQRAHAASAFWPSPFEEAGVLVVDDFGEWATAALARGSGDGLAILSELHFPHSLGLLASAIAQFLGFEPGADEHKVEALARLGSPRFARELELLAPALDGGAFTIDEPRFRFALDGEHLFDESLSELFGPPRIPGTPLTLSGEHARDADLAASLQALLEARVLALARELHRRAPCAALCFVGQLAKNRSLNARLLAVGPFRKLFVPPDPDDAGAALGAALAVHHARAPQAPRWRCEEVRLGLGAGEGKRDGGRVLGAGAVDELARTLAAGRTLAWVRGRGELACESLGARSLLCDARLAGARRRLLESVRQDEAFLGCRLIVAAERARELFELPDGAEHALRFGWIAAKPRARLVALAPDVQDPAWPQVVARESDPELHRLLEACAAQSDIPCLWHATFALRGSPQVRGEHDALEAFRRSGLDLLCVEDRLYERESVRAR